jgi:hypothetical protein
MTSRLIRAIFPKREAAGSGTPSRQAFTDLSVLDEREYVVVLDALLSYYKESLKRTFYEPMVVNPEHFNRAEPLSHAETYALYTRLWEDYHERISKIVRLDTLRAWVEAQPDDQTAADRLGLPVEQLTRLLSGQLVIPEGLQLPTRNEGRQR